LSLTLRDVGAVSLPTTYNAAVTALRECARLDECRDWGSKAAAIVSYARQAGDRQLFEMAVRIRLRAIRRCGELLQEIEAAKRGRKLVSVPAPNSGAEGRFKAAQDAGLSRRQTVTALRVANVPAVEFEQAVESGAPPTVSVLTERGRRPAPRFPQTVTALVQVTHAAHPGRALEEVAVEREVERLMAVWRMTGRAARLRFLEIIGVRDG
jgi:hypothetical protein